MHGTQQQGTRSGYKSTAKSIAVSTAKSGAGLVSTALALGGAAALVIAAGATLAAVMARTVVTPPAKRDDDTLIRAVDVAAGTITVQRNADSVLDGDYSFFFSSGTGHARLGEVLERTPVTVTRRLLGVDYGDLTVARRGRVSGWLYTGPADLEYPWETVHIATEGGLAPAWLIPVRPDALGQHPARTDWVIQVHGRAVRREEALRAVPVFREAGYTSLLVSYRNDGDAPASADRRYGLGDTEWRDVEAAIAFAVGAGAHRIVLMGWSMGGAIVLQNLTRSALADRIVGVVLESPVIDWADVIAAQGRDLHLPAPIACGAHALLGHRVGRLVTGQAQPIGFDRLDFVARSAELNRPILLLHSDDDGFVPPTGSRRLAALRPDLVTFVLFRVARHTKLWNYDRARFDESIRTWLADLPTPTA